MKTKEWQDKWLEFASWPCNSRVERAGRWAHRWGRAPELVLAKSMQNTYMHFCYLAACQSSVKAGKACKIGPFGRCGTKQGQKQTFVGHIFACSFCSVCVFTLNGSYLLSGTHMKSKEWQDKWLECASCPWNSRVERASMLIVLLSATLTKQRNGCTLKVSLDLQDKDTAEGNPKN